MLFVLAVLLIAAVLLFPYVSTVWHRGKMLRHLETVARRGGFRLRRIHRFTVLSRNSGGRCDFLVENRECVFAVKLRSAVRRNVTLRIGSEGLATEEITGRVPLWTDRKNRTHTTRRRAGNVHLPALPVKYAGKRIIVPVLLVYPSYREVLAEQGGEWSSVHSGDMVGEQTLYSPSAFEKRILSAAPRKTPQENRKKEEKRRG